ncbi:zinc ribbon domain-containing protein [Candidatus Enterovibrio escicola]|uniref:zinc ribbon domain-containing protein n=1 Tax=Candidatus Enterovibrio escicola TaxID=1927127 RepID=UPI001237ADE1
MLAFYIKRCCEVKVQEKKQSKHILKLNQWYLNSKICHCFGHKMEEISLSVRKWDYHPCGILDIDRDLNTALNIRDKASD